MPLYFLNTVQFCFYLSAVLMFKHCAKRYSWDFPFYLLWCIVRRHNDLSLSFPVKDDIGRLNEEASLESKLNELDKLETASKNSPGPAWWVHKYTDSKISPFLVILTHYDCF